MNRRDFIKRAAIVPLAGMAINDSPKPWATRSYDPSTKRATLETCPEGKWQDELLFNNGEIHADFSINGQLWKRGCVQRPYPRVTLAVALPCSVWSAGVPIKHLNFELEYASCSFEGPLVYHYNYNDNKAMIGQDGFLAFS